MDLLSTRDEPARDPQLGRDDWIRAGLLALLEDGIAAVQITRLARALGVTRGSFYWHFKGREDLLSALLAEWSARNTGVMRGVMDGARTLEQGVLELFAVWVDHSKYDPALDQAVRDWARRDTAVSAVVAREDDERVAAIAAFYARHGFEGTEAFIRARILYFTQLSFYALGVSEPMETRMSYLAAYYRGFTGQEISRAGADAFRARLLAREAAE